MLFCVYFVDLRLARSEEEKEGEWVNQNLSSKNCSREPQIHNINAE